MTEARSPGLKWQILETHERYRNPWIWVREDQVIRTDDSTGLYGVVSCRPAVGVVARTDDGRYVLVEQSRYATDRRGWEICKGAIHIEHDEAIVDAAQRELAEETSYRAQNWRSLGVMHSEPGFADNVVNLFLAEELTPISGEREEHEWDLHSAIFSWEQIIDLINNAEMTDAVSIASLYRVQFSTFE